MSTTAPLEHTQTQATGEFPAGLTYTAYAAYRLREPLGARDREELAAEAQRAMLQTHGVVIRGAYDVAGMRADCDVMMWLVGPSADSMQSAQAALRRTELGGLLTPFWQSIGVHREAEFNRSHVPAFFAGESPRRWLCAYPFVRTVEWYLLEPNRRRDMLIEHGQMARDYPDVRANTVSAFGLNDYEWLLAFEADDLVRIVDLIRDLRAAEARLYTKNELPFITGRRKALVEILGELP